MILICCPIIYSSVYFTNDDINFNVSIIIIAGSAKYTAMYVEAILVTPAYDGILTWKNDFTLPCCVSILLQWQCQSV